jgi:gas vesicle protein
MSDEIKRAINNLKDDLKREVSKSIDILYNIQSRLERLEEESKRELKNIKYTLEDIKNKINK